MNPEQAVRAFVDLGARQFLAIHPRAMDGRGLLIEQLLDEGRMGGRRRGGGGDHQEEGDVQCLSLCGGELELQPHAPSVDADHGDRK